MIRGQAPVIQALLAGLFTWVVTALGSGLVFVMSSQSKKLLDVSLGFAAGVMTAASFWSLLAPAIEISERTMESFAFIPVAVGFAVGAAFVHFADKMLPSCVLSEATLVDHLAPSKTETELALVGESSEGARGDSNIDGYELRRRVPRVEGEIGKKTSMGTTKVGDESVERLALKESWRRIVLLILAVTVHNIPEGLAVGVGFASIGKAETSTFETAFNLAIGIGLQNFPEGLAVSLPLAAFGHSKLKAFFYGQLSGMVEPIAALAGAGLIIVMEPILPYALSFAAGAMIYVVVDDIIPEAQRHGNGKLASVGTIAGFIVMMSLDVGLG
ncbi:hypothetical protein PFISCL1PPCAC_20016 [Pristionchus fissidentatus]|uniref:Zinc transporter ZIP11 n=1 Tax=Pristionchus fissidentatus TaxID=1538716 RepID=A0AAV5WFV6_9BILA|nr:hypothetical protein PFISCL1PPCAC_20016 [Pristionchus fissidentatus]